MPKLSKIPLSNCSVQGILCFLYLPSVSLQFLMLIHAYLSGTFCLLGTYRYLVTWGQFFTGWALGLFYGTLCQLFKNPHTSDKMIANQKLPYHENNSNFLTYNDLIVIITFSTLFDNYFWKIIFFCFKKNLTIKK